MNSSRGGKERKKGPGTNIWKNDVHDECKASPSPCPLTGLGDNTFIGSFFHSMESDVIHGIRFLDDSTLLKAVNRYIWRYNGWRRHSSIGSRRPIDFERVAA